MHFCRALVIFFFFLRIAGSESKNAEAYTNLITRSKVLQSAMQPCTQKQWMVAHHRLYWKDGILLQQQLPSVLL